MVGDETHSHDSFRLLETQDEFGMGSNTSFSAYGPTLNPLESARSAAPAVDSAVHPRAVSLAASDRVSSTVQTSGALGGAAAAARPQLPAALPSPQSARTQARPLLLSDGAVPRSRWVTLNSHPRTGPPRRERAPSCRVLRARGFQALLRQSLQARAPPRILPAEPWYQPPRRPAANTTRCAAPGGAS